MPGAGTHVGEVTVDLTDAASRPTGRQAASRRRAERAVDWCAQTDRVVVDRPLSLVVDPDGTVFLLEDGRHRRVISRLLAAALEVRIGPPETASTGEEEGRVLGPPVVVFEGPVGGPFVVVGGVRHRVVGLPLPHPVGQGFVDSLTAGEPIDVGRLVQPSCLRSSDGVVSGDPVPIASRMRLLPSRSIVRRGGAFARSNWAVYRRFGLAGLTAEVEDRIEQAGFRRMHRT